MESLSGKKIFVLYPDTHIRENIFHGLLRDQFDIYYIFDYEKIRPLVEYYPGSILCINFVANDLFWIIEELEKELFGLSPDDYPKVAVLSDRQISLPNKGYRFIDCRELHKDFKKDLSGLFVKWGGKGRRNFVRYGGAGESVAKISIEFDNSVIRGTVHDISASGLSCSLDGIIDIPISDNEITTRIELTDIVLELPAFKILERVFPDKKIHVLQFSKSLSIERIDELYSFIHSSLYSKMDEFIKKISN